MNKFLKFFVLVIVSVILATGLIYYGIIYRIDMNEIKLTLKENIEKNLPGSEFQVEDISHEVGLRVSLNLKNVKLTHKETSSNLIIAKSLVIKIPFVSMLSGRGVNRIKVKDLYIENDTSKWRRILPESAVAKSIITRVKLPYFLVGNQTSLEIKNLSISDSVFKKISFKNLSLSHDSAFEFTKEQRITLVKGRSIDSTFRFVGELNLKQLLDKKASVIKGNIFLNQNKLEPENFKLPSVKGDAEISVKKDQSYQFSTNLDAEGILFGRVVLSNENGFESLDGDLKINAQRFIDFFHLASRLPNVSINNSVGEIKLNLNSEGKIWKGSSSVNFNQGFDVDLLNSRATLVPKLLWNDKTVNLALNYQFEKGHIDSSFTFNPFPFVEQSKLNVKGRILLDGLNLTKKDLIQFLAVSRVVPHLNQTLTEVPVINISLDSNNIFLEEKEAKLSGKILSEYSQGTAIVNLKMAENAELNSIVRKDYSRPESLNLYDLSFKNLDIEYLKHLSPYYLSQIEGKFSGKIQYSEDVEQKLITDGIVSIKSPKNSNVSSELANRSVAFLKDNSLLNEKLSSTEIISMGITGTIDKNTFFFNSYEFELLKCCRLVFTGSSELNSSVALNGVLNFKNGVSEVFKVKGDSFNDLNFFLDTKGSNQ